MSSTWPGCASSPTAARRRLPAEPDHGTAVPVVEHRLSRAVAAAEGSPTDRGLAVLVNERHLAMVTLPFEPRDRAVVDGAFATRDLEYALQRYPLYRPGVARPFSPHPGRPGPRPRPTQSPHDPRPKPPAPGSPDTGPTPSAITPTTLTIYWTSAFRPTGGGRCSSSAIAGT